MIVRYRVLSERLKAELENLEKVIGRVEGALQRAAQQPENVGYFVSAAALDLHGFYAGIERLLELIAGELDGGLPAGTRWHRDLLEQMSIEIAEVRPAVFQPETHQALLEYLEFRHVVRNVYTFELQAERVKELAGELRSVFELARRDLFAFIEFLTELSKADKD